MPEPLHHFITRTSRRKKDPKRKTASGQHIDRIQHYIFVKTKNKVFIHVVRKPGLYLAFFWKLDEKEHNEFVNHPIYRKTSRYSMVDVELSPVLSESFMIAIRARSGGLLPKAF
jgi:hypothetical protein